MLLFISKMKSLPPTSDIKIIDMWLILCQLASFARLVLLTVKEYLRKDEKDSLENDDIQPTTPDVTLEYEFNPKEAWVSSPRELLKAGSITMLMIGKILIQNSVQWFSFQRRKCCH